MRFPAILVLLSRSAIGTSGLAGREPTPTAPAGGNATQEHGRRNACAGEHGRGEERVQDRSGVVTSAPYAPMRLAMHLAARWYSVPVVSWAGWASTSSFMNDRSPIWSMSRGACQPRELIMRPLPPT